MFKKLLKRDKAIIVELSKTYKWYKEPRRFTEAIVSQLKTDGRSVEIISVVENVVNTRIARLLIDGQKYEVTIEAPSFVTPSHKVALYKIKDS